MWRSEARVLVGRVVSPPELEDAADGGGAVGEIDVVPVEAEEFAFAEFSVQGEFEQGLPSIRTSRREDLLRLR
jgi:hypothetical protein